MIPRLVRKAPALLAALAIPGLAAAAYSLPTFRSALSTRFAAQASIGLPVPAVGQILVIPRPVAAPQNLRSQEEFLNLLVGSEARLIKVQRQTIHATIPLFAAATRLDFLVGQSAHPSARLLAAAANLTARVQKLNFEIAFNQQRLVVGLNNELATFGFISATNPFIANRNAYRRALGLQQFQVGNLGTYTFDIPPATPVNRPPNRR